MKNWNFIEGMGSLHKSGRHDDFAQEMYLELMRRALTRHNMERHQTVMPANPYGFVFNWKVGLAERANHLLRKFGFEIAKTVEPSSRAREMGQDWPINAETMIGIRRLEQLHFAMHTLKNEKIKGSLMETGVWRGGACIYMAAFCKVYQYEKEIIAADSFRGLPVPDPENEKENQESNWHAIPYLSVSLEDVKSNFADYGLSGEEIRFVPGFFSDTLPSLDVDEIALLRLDGDMYSSTIDVLENMYDKVVEDGFVIIDDYRLDSAQSAVSDFLEKRGLSPAFEKIDEDAIFWRKTSV